MATDGDLRGILSEPVTGSDEDVLRRVGMIRITEDDVASGLVLRAEALVDIKPASKVSHGRISRQREVAVVHDGARLYEEWNGTQSISRDEPMMGHTPTRPERGFIHFGILVQGPDDADFRPLSGSDVSK